MTYDSIALIDLSYLFKKRYHTTTITGHMAAAKATLADIEALKKDVGHLIICKDSPPYSRKLIHPDYKANRPDPEPEERAQRAWLYKEILAAGYPVAAVTGYEADDVIATLARKYADVCTDVRIVCPDKDAAQCVTEHIRQFIPPVGDRDWEVRDIEGVKKRFGVCPHEMPLMQALMGDSSDNVPGVPKVGEKTAAALVRQYGTLAKLAEGVAAEVATGKKNAVMDSLAANWESLVLSLKLVTLDINVPIDADALLAPPAPPPPKKEIEMTPANDTKPVDHELSDRIAAAGIEASERAAAAIEAMEQPRRTEWAEQAKRMHAIVPAYTQGRYGMTTADLQPLDLESASTMAKWFCEGGLFRQYENAQQIFSIMVRAKELGIGMAMALSNHHVIEGKPVANADLIRALAERDPNFEYLMPIEMSDTRVVWEGKHKRQPKPVPYTYTIEMARQAGLVRKSSYGKEGNWTLRPQDMLNKTAGTKLARLLWPGATMGFYCPEEMGFSTEELEARAAA